MSTYFNGDVKKNQEDNSSVNPISRFIQHYNAVFDKIQFYLYERWISVGILSFLYIFRLIYTQGIIL